MNNSIPLDAFRDCAHGVLISDRCGKVCFCNHAARSLLQTTPEEALGKPCWTVAQFRGLDGEPFCSVRCPHMNEITLEDTLEALRHNRYEVDVPEPTRTLARSSIERMLTIS